MTLRPAATPIFALSARLQGEREGTRRASDGEGEVGRITVGKYGSPRLTPTLFAPGGEEGGRDCGWP
jgi:hypothetical protein